MEQMQSMNLPEDEPLYPQMPIEKFKRVSGWAVIWTVVGMVALVMAADLWVFLYLLRDDSIDRGGIIVRHKWAMLRSLEEPVDTIVLGDSSVNQAVRPEIITDELGIEAVNLATVGTWAFADNTWMVRYYLEQYGVPESVVVLHTFDVPIRPSPTIEVAASWGLDPAIIFDPTSPFHDANLLERATFYQWHFFPLYFRRSLVNALFKDWITNGFQISQSSSYFQGQWVYGCD